MDDRFRRRVDGTVAGDDDKKLRPPSLRQRKLFVELTKNQSAKQACVRAGYSPKTPTSVVIAKLSETTLRSELEKLGFRPDVVARRIVDGLDAEVAKPLGKGEYIMTPDWTNRHRYLTTALRIFGVQVTGSGAPDRAPVPELHLNVYRQVFNLMDQSLQMMGHRAVEVDIVE